MLSAYSTFSYETLPPVASGARPAATANVTVAPGLWGVTGIRDVP